ncbi:rhamnulokinase [Paenibacillus sp. CAU 1782]
MSSVLAFDLGASSGRAMIGHLENGRIEISELHRFSNDPVRAGSGLYWDILRLLHELQTGLWKAKAEGHVLDSLGIDSWGVDFGLIDGNGELLGNPRHYRDAGGNDVMERVVERLTVEKVFGNTGIQLMPINTLYQLASLEEKRSPLLREGKHFLMIPALLRYYLTGQKANEFTLATTSQAFNPFTGDWDDELLAAVGSPRNLFAPVVQPGTEVGQIRESLCEELGIEPTPVIAVAEHDTGSAVAAVPAEGPGFAYLSCGTWSLIGTEVDAPVITDRSRELNFTNEGGVYGTYRLLKNIMGLWILQECRREWERQGKSFSFPELVALAGEATPFAVFLDVDDDLFLQPGDMPARIGEYCRKTGQAEPSSLGATVRAVLEGLAFKYRYALEQTEELAGTTFQGLNMVGGGIQNTLLCQWTSDALGKPVWAGPVEGSAIGNMLVQWIARGQIEDIWQARSIVKASFPIVTYEPKGHGDWAEAYHRYLVATGLSAS